MFISRCRSRKGNGMDWLYTVKLTRDITTEAQNWTPIRNRQKRLLRRTWRKDAEAKMRTISHTQNTQEKHDCVWWRGNIISDLCST